MYKQEVWIPGQARYDVRYYSCCNSRVCTSFLIFELTLFKDLASLLTALNRCLSETKTEPISSRLCNKKFYFLLQSQQTQEVPTVKPEEQQESNKRKREEDNDLHEKAKEGNQSIPVSKPTAFEVLSEAAKDTAKFAQALGKGLTEGASEAVKAQLEFIKDLATKPLETLEKEYVTPIKEILKDIILSGEFNEGFHSLSNSEIQKKALEHFGKDFVDNVEKFKTTWSIANNVQRTEIMGRIVGGILANKTINNLGKKVFTGGGKSWVGQEKIVGDGVKNIGKKVDWTPHDYKHFPKKNMSWKDTVKSTKDSRVGAKYRPEINVESLERNVWETGTPVTTGKSWKVKEFDYICGACDGKETKYMRVEESAGVIHGHPITEQEYRKLTKKNM